MFRCKLLIGQAVSGKMFEIVNANGHRKLEHEYMKAFTCIGLKFRRTLKEKQEVILQL